LYKGYWLIVKKYFMKKHQDFYINMA
jgi:hypothetical protein